MVSENFHVEEFKGLQERAMISYSYYVLDIVHTGHLLLMKNAKAIVGKSGKSIVGILTDDAIMEKKKKPILSLKDRMAVAEAIECVDLVVVQETYSPLPNVKRIKPDILMESSSHSKEAIEKVREVMKSIGGRVVVTPYYPLQSSTRIKKKIRK